MVRISGRVHWFNVKKGYGFIYVHKNDQYKDETIFCHQSNISPIEETTFRKIFPGEYVSFDINNNNGKVEAIDVKGINEGPLLIDNESYNYKIFTKNMNDQSGDQSEDQSGD